MKTSVCNLADAISKYAAYLQQQNVKVQENHRSLVPVRSSSDSESCTLIKGARWIQPSLVSQFKALQLHLDAATCFHPILLNDFAPADSW